MSRKIQRDDALDLIDAKDELLFQLEMQRTETEQELVVLREQLAELQSSNDYYSRLYKLAPIGRVTLDQKAKIRELNLVAERMLDIPHDEAIGLPFMLFITKQNVSKFVRHLRRCRLFPDERIESELVFRGSNKEEIPLLMLSTVSRVEGEMFYETALININAQKSAEQLFEEAKKGAENIFQMVDQPLLMVDTELSVVSANPAFHRSFKTISSKIIGTSFERLTGENPWTAKLRELLVEVIEQKKSFEKFRIETMRADGTQRVLLLGARPFFPDPRSGELILVSISDVTQAGMGDQEREQLLQKLAQMGLELETRVEERTNELQTVNWKLQTLSARMLEAQEMDRRHLARELHDEVGQQITCLQILIEKQISLAPPALRSALEETRHASSELLETVRELSSDVRPQLLDDFGLIAALVWHFKKFHKRTGIEVKLNKKDFHDDLLNSFLRNVIFRVTQEALTNVARHAETKRVDVMLGTRKGFCTLKISDKGKGFDVKAALKKESFGLLGLQERTFLAGGTLKLDSVPGKGTNVVIELPLLAPHTDVLEREHTPPLYRSGG